MLSRVRIVLVSPAGAANVGATARAMTNMGVHELVLVAPACDPNDEQARNFASNAAATLSNCRIVADIPEALTGCVCTFATTARDGMYRRQFVLDPMQAAELALSRTTEGPVAFLFGPERTGLTNSDLLHADRVVTIPADPAYPVLNLAASVLLVCYELRKVALARSLQARPLDRRSGNERAREALLQAAPAERKAAMFRHLFDALDRIHFFADQNPEHLRHALRQMFGRMDLTLFECDVVIGMARQIVTSAHRPTVQAEGPVQITPAPAADDR